ncbi:MAG: PQQ-dependent sugar dehydrogenase [Bacteroidota bacterium]
MKKIIPTILCAFLSVTLCSQNITLEVFASGFDDPIDIKNAGDDRLFVVEQGGTIRILNSDGTTNATPFIDLSSIVLTGSERGLLGLAFHPDYATNGYFYVNYTNASGDTQVSRFSVSSGNPDIADPASELQIIDYNQPFSNHNGGSINFGSDGFLYISSGDGGSGGDPGNRAQNTTLLLGKMLRIDVDNPSGGNNYGIPSDNPFAGSSSDAQEIWAYGLRNAWKFSFDRMNGDIWIADVGQGEIEEINKAGATEAGLNYGWRCYEGSLPFNTSNCPDPSELTFPVAEYDHSQGFSITGGYVYRGSLYNNMEGFYFAADFGSGRIVTVDPANNFNNLGTFGGNWSSFGEDVNGELYIANYSGAISKIIGENLSVEDNPMLEVRIFPNPANDRVTVQLAQGNVGSIEIMDIKGSILYTEDNMVSSSQEIAVDGLAQGIYLLRVVSAQGSAVKKLVIQ